jgi:hypothetical protein
LEQMAELWMTLKGAKVTWEDALASLKKAVAEAQRKGHHIDLGTSVIRDRHVLAIDSAARYDPWTRRESCDYDGLYFAIGKFIQEIVEKHGTADFELAVQRKGASG